MAEDFEQQIELMRAMLIPVMEERFRKGEISGERLAALRGIMADFDRARALPDLEDRVVEMKRVMARMNATFAQEPR
ncbi:MULTISPECIES: hypothetical protein [unclassified Bradyrhizobium]|uniref:hypothetical protein n=1 Tax=unclassified Bradyrhizobium TaxID=2631580 RepID=UPI001BAB7A20|nr:MULTISPECIES: hypothetical protein [unclassified Bradyrhizobium]MBR1206785.1 hypothetical protein [Bradyrhizobium sp. AUGA SZCCT0124]MBR1316779.1 hypothetical protein [Bradyrhizobium sp. AUGA SZCCT0051]MBR1344849.1 hypothetical protein [Bradyrhizobium sp. AUGA SZCCT0105]MBR1356355.1 hypothetical protein [Bradyrhizobium sp. AUGA SZCCT0045]